MVYLINKVRAFSIKVANDRAIFYYIVAGSAIIIVQIPLFNTNYVWHDDWMALERWAEPCFQHGWNGWLIRIGRPLAYLLRSRGEVMRLTATASLRG